MTEIPRMMEERITDIAAFEAFVATLDNDCLFRGQVSHHTGDDGYPSITTSFHRKGCIPPLMVKWTYYADEILRVLSSVSTLTHSLKVNHAILQHYGWRSFFIDVTKNVAVAAWFAGHKFQSHETVAMSEDCHEAFVMLRHQVARYEPHAGEGHLYVISKGTAAERKIEFVDLDEELPCEDTIPRFHRQSAGLLGQTERLPPEAIRAHLIVPADILRDYAMTHGMSAAFLFPAREEDFFLKLLLSVPWERIESDLPLWQRGLRLPEYDYNPIRFQSPTTAFYRNQWIARDRERAFSDATVYELEDSVFFGHPQSFVLKVPLVSQMLRVQKLIVIETAGLIRHPELYQTSQYAKGLVLLMTGEACVEVSELEVDHPGTSIRGIRALRPWSYQIAPSGEWYRISRPDDCPCNNTGRHERHTWAVIIFEELLCERRFNKNAEHVFHQL